MTLYLAHVGFVDEFVGVLLWPAAVVHAILSTFSALLCWLHTLAASSVGFWPQREARARREIVRLSG